MTGALILLVLSLISLAAGQSCVPYKPWEDFSKVDFKAKCPGFPSTFPRFDQALSCVTREVDPELALSISNGLFDCDKWCVYSMSADEAWIWIPSEQCFLSGPGCLTIKDEVALFQSARQRICAAPPRTESTCIPVIRTPLSLKTIQAKCPGHTVTSKPAYHSAVTCETGKEDGELAQALVNGAFEECKNWCVYSIKSPKELAWFWDHNRSCWTATNECTKIGKELQYAVQLTSKLCSKPCVPARKENELTPQLIARKCPNYTLEHSPQFHHAVLCDTDPPREDPALRHSLANFAFSECKNWCVYSLEEPQDKAWLWDPARMCWRTQAKMCMTLESEIEFSMKVRDSLCLGVTPRSLAARRKQRAQVVAKEEEEEQGGGIDPLDWEEAKLFYVFFFKIILAVMVFVSLLQFAVPPNEDGTPNKADSKQSGAEEKKNQ